MSWITAEQVFAKHYGSSLDSIPVRPHAKLVERGLVLERDDFVIAYQLCFNEVEDEEIREMGVEDAYDMDCVLCDKKGNTLDVDGFYDVFTDISYKEETLKNVKENWRSLIIDDVYRKMELYKQGNIIGRDVKPSVKRQLNEYRFMLEKYFPALCAVIPSEIFNRR